jgi:hypothetical protein
LSMLLDKSSISITYHFPYELVPLPWFFGQNADNAQKDTKTHVSMRHTWQF